MIIKFKKCLNLSLQRVFVLSSVVFCIDICSVSGPALIEKMKRQRINSPFKSPICIFKWEFTLIPVLAFYIDVNYIILWKKCKKSAGSTEIRVRGKWEIRSGGDVNSSCVLWMKRVPTLRDANRPCSTDFETLTIRKIRKYVFRSYRI